MAQTLEDFLAKPFGNTEPRSTEFEAKYKKLVSSKRIHMEACTKVDNKNYLVHIKVGSDSNETMFYDVVLLFFTESEEISKDVSFRRYFVKFFSNSPSFIYQYAVLYRQNDMLIDALGEKMDALYADKLPEKANPNLRISYDKSIYGACRYMQDHKLSAFNKAGFFAKRKKPLDKFFADIKSFEDVKFTTSIANIGKKTEKNAAKSSDEKSPEGKRPQKGKVVTKAPTVTRINAKHSTVQTATRSKKAGKVKRI
jgi:hypothetical protein